MNLLIYQRKASKRTDGYSGLLYLHTWSTGHQMLIFRDRSHAERWAASDSETYEIQHGSAPQ